MIPPTLQTANYSLEPYREKDLERYLEMSLEKDVVAFMGGATGDISEERNMFKKIFEVYNSDSKRWFWVWGVYKNNILCAHLELKQTQDTNTDELEIVYMVHPMERGKGLMTEVLHLLKQHQSIWNKRITATISPKNKKSMKLLELWGIESEKELKDAATNEVYVKLVLSK